MKGSSALPGVGPKLLLEGIAAKQLALHKTFVGVKPFERVKSQCLSESLPQPLPWLQLDSGNVSTQENLLR